MDKPILLISFVIFGAAQLAYAQGVCVHKPLKVNTVEGRVIAVLKDGNEQIVDEGDVTVLKRSKKNWSKHLKLDKSGRFSFIDLGRGQYSLTIRNAHLPIFEVDLVLSDKNSNTVPPSSQEIVITLGYELLSPCKGSKAEIRKRD